MILKFRPISPKSLAAAVILLPYQLLLLVTVVGMIRAASSYSSVNDSIRLDAVKSGALQSKSELTKNGHDFDASDYPAFLTGVNMVSPDNRALSPHRLLLNQYYCLRR